MRLGCFPILLFALRLWTLFSVGEIRPACFAIVIVPVRVIRRDRPLSPVYSDVTTTVPFSVISPLPTEGVKGQSPVSKQESSATVVIPATGVPPARLPNPARTPELPSPAKALQPSSPAKALQPSSPVKTPQPSSPERTSQPSSSTRTPQTPPPAPSSQPLVPNAPPAKTTALPYQDCVAYLSPEYCSGKDRRDEFVFPYRKHNSTRRYLIVVNHHWNYTNSVQFLRNTLYEKFSDLYPVDFDLLNMGPDFQSKAKIVCHSLRVGGEYSYYTLHRAYTFLKGYARYDGYFLINDDAFLDPFFLQDYDLRKSWHEPTAPYVWDKPWSWNYLKNEKGVRYPQAFREAIEEVVGTPDLERPCQLRNADNQRRSLQDFFYVAAVDMPLWLQLADVFYKHRVFLEQAAPTINWCLSHNKIVTCNHHNWPDVQTCVHLHPIKLGQEGNQRLALLRMTHLKINAVPSMSWLCVCW